MTNRGFRSQETVYLILWMGGNRVYGTTPRHGRSRLRERYRNHRARARAWAWAWAWVNFNFLIFFG